MNILKRITCAMLALTCTTMMFTSCDSDSNNGGGTSSTNTNSSSTSSDADEDGDLVNVYGDYIIKIDGKSISFEEYRYYFHYLKSYMDQGDDSYWSKDATAIDTLKEAVEEQLKYVYSIPVIAEKWEVELTDENIKKAEDEISALIESLGGEEEYQTALDQRYLTKEMYLDMAKQAQYQNEIIKKQFSKEILKTAETDYLHAQHILIAFDKNEDGKNSDEEKASAQKQIEEIMDKVEAGEDFTGLIEEYGEDPGQNPAEGYYFKDGEMVEAFYEGTKGLKVGEYGDYVETEYGYHIIKRLPIEEDYIYSDVSQFMTQEQIEAINKEAEEVSKGLKVEYCEKYDIIGIGTM